MKFYSLTEELNFSHKRYLLEDKIIKSIISKGYSVLEPNVNILSSDLTKTIIRDIRKRVDENEILKIAYRGTTLRKIGAEFIGSESMDSDIEILKLVLEILELIGEEYVLEISHSSFLNNLLYQSNIEKALYPEIFEAIKQRDSFKVSKFIELENIFKLNGNIQEIALNLEKYNQSTSYSLEKLISLDMKLSETFSKKPNIVYDMAMVSDQEYYSGVIFKAYIKNSNSAIIKGGRYTIKDTKVGDLQAVGFSVEIDNLNRVISNQKRSFESEEKK